MRLLIIFCFKLGIESNEAFKITRLKATVEIIPNKIQMLNFFVICSHEQGMNNYNDLFRIQSSDKRCVSRFLQGRIKFITRKLKFEVS